MNDYTIQVTFTRDLENDGEVVGETTPTKLVQQFCRELQEFAYDGGWVDGTFQVNSITVNGKTTEIKSPGPKFAHLFDPDHIA